MANNGDTDRWFKVKVGAKVLKIQGVGSFHKTLPHTADGEVDPKKVNAGKTAFDILVDATRGKAAFQDVPGGDAFLIPKLAEKLAKLTNPQAGLAKDPLTRDPAGFDMPPAPAVLSDTTAAEMVELYWMALLRDTSLTELPAKAKVAAADIDKAFRTAVAQDKSAGRFRLGEDIPGSAAAAAKITPQNIFRLGLPGEDIGPMVSQFFIRDANYGTQTIVQKQVPYRTGANYLTRFKAWLHAQNTGNGEDGKAYPAANEAAESYYEEDFRYISTLRDLARFVNKDALHQAYFNAAILLLSGGAQWTPGNPYAKGRPLEPREAGFGTLGGPHILALVSEVATRALKIVWNQKWQVNLRLRPEAYGGLAHVQHVGAPGRPRRNYGLPAWLFKTDAAGAIRSLDPQEPGLLLPMAFTPGSPTHPAYGAGHATVAGACVTVLKAYFRTFDDLGNGKTAAVLLTGPVKDQEKTGTLIEKATPYSEPCPFKTYITGVDNQTCKGFRKEQPFPDLTIEGELNKLAMNVAMGRSMGGVHWRTDNTRSLVLGEAIAAQILAEITTDLAEKPVFAFRTFTRKTDGEPKIVRIAQGRIYVDGVQVDTASSAL